MGAELPEIARPALLTEAEAARHLRVCPRTLRKERQAGRLPYVLIGRCVRYAPADLESYKAAKSDNLAAEEDTAEEVYGEAPADNRTVYFIGARRGPIKIGVAANPRTRLYMLQTGNPERLHLLATCQGGSAQEAAYHKMFADIRLGGEWFSRSPELLAEIARLKSILP